MPVLNLEDLELIEYLEVALVGLTMFPNNIGETMDLSVEYIEQLREKLHRYMNDV